MPEQRPPVTAGRGWTQPLAQGPPPMLQPQGAVVAADGAAPRLSRAGGPSGSGLGIPRRPRAGEREGPGAPRSSARPGGWNTVGRLCCSLLAGCAGLLAPGTWDSSRDGRGSALERRGRLRDCRPPRRPRMGRPASSAAGGYFPERIIYPLR